MPKANTPQMNSSTTMATGDDSEKPSNTSTAASKTNSTRNARCQPRRSARRPPARLPISVAMPNTTSKLLAVAEEKPVMSVRIGVMKVNAAKLAPKPRMVTSIIDQIAG